MAEEGSTALPAVVAIVDKINAELRAAIESQGLHLITHLALWHVTEICGHFVSCRETKRPAIL